MKLLFLAILVAASSGIADTDTPTKGLGIQCLPKNLPPPACDSTTDAQLKAVQDGAKFGGLAAEGFHRETWDLESHSQFIHFGDQTTLVPKGAILNVPKKLRDHIVTAPVGKMVLWNEFLGTYRGAVTFFEVDLQQAAGVKELDAAKYKIACNTDRIVVAVCDHNPISVVRRATATPPNR
jgi:hypothetical protein